VIRDRKLWLGLAFTAAALWWAMRGIDLGLLGHTLATAQWQWLLLSLPLYLVGYWSRARRVSQLLAPIKKVPTSRILPPLVIGFLFNNVLPARLGEFVFAWLLGKREGISRTASFAVVVLSRILDGITIVAFFLFGLFAFLQVGGDGGGETLEVAGMLFSREELLGKVYLAGIGGAILFGLVSAACFALIAWRDLASRLAGRVLTVLPRRFSEAGLGALDRFIRGLDILKDPGRLFGVFLFNFVPWGLELFTYYFGARVFGLELTLRESALIMGMTNLAMLVPSGPGGLGLFELGGMMVMALLGVEKTVALAYIVMVHAIILLPINVWGGWYLWREGISFGEALRSSSEPDKARPKDGKRKRHG
jgi:glycosyltransferase 2 family protein